MHSAWTYEEEDALLSGIIEHGWGNWDKILLKIPNRDAVDCEQHYLTRFIEHPEEPELQRIVESHGRAAGLCSDNCSLSLLYDPDNFRNNHSVAHMLDRARRVEQMDDAARHGRHGRRPPPGVTASLLRGYNPARSEFDTEYDDRAESVLPCLSQFDEDSDFEREDDCRLHQELKVALVDSYNFRLSERMRWKKIIRRHGLLDRSKCFSVIHRFENVCGRMQISALMQCMRFLSGPQMDYFLESLRVQKDLKVRISRLSAYRRLGIRHFEVVPSYEKMHRKRVKHKHLLEINSSSIILGFKYQKKPSAPLDIHNLPGYMDLEDEEKELCSTSRIVPETFLSFKSLMMQECRKLDGLKLKQARQLFKIDVNKTRKIYDHLISKQLIWTSK